MIKKQTTEWLGVVGMVVLGAGGGVRKLLRVQVATVPSERKGIRRVEGWKQLR